MLASSSAFRSDRVPPAVPTDGDGTTLPTTLRKLPVKGGIVHATTVAVGTRALLIAGPSGSGKSSLALKLLAMGALLDADDQTVLRPVEGGTPNASAPTNIAGRIEARGLGLLSVPTAPPTPLAAILNLALHETERLPPYRSVAILGANVPVLHNVDTPYFPSALFLYLQGERTDP